MYEKLTAAKTAPKILTIDIETKPAQAYVWGLYDQNVGLNQLTSTSEVMCFAAKWYGQRKISFFSEHADGHDTMIRAAWKLLDEADIVVGHNSRAFDLKHLNREFLLAGLNPPSPYKQVDTLSVARAAFKFQSNKLDFIAKALGVGAKTVHTGFQLWLDCMAGDERAWRLMERYNRQDVRITEAVYDRLRPWIKNHPHHGVVTGATGGCPTCGSTKSTYNGIVHSTVQSYDSYRCSGCGAVYRSTLKLSEPLTTRAVA